MNQLLLDLRENVARYLVTSGRDIVAEGQVEIPLLDTATLGSLVEHAGAAAGRKPEQLHLILPAAVVSQNHFRLQQMGAADAEKIVRRAVSAELGVDPVLQLTPFATREGERDYLAESLRPETLQEYQGLARSVGLRLKSATSGLHANLAAVEEHRGKILEGRGIVDIGSHGVEVLYLTATELLHYERVRFPELEPLEDEEAGERSQRRKIFAVVNTIYGCQVNFQQALPRQGLDGIWLTGSGSALPGVTAALGDALGTPVAPLPGMESDSGTAALRGLARSLQEGSGVNFLARAPGTRRRFGAPRLAAQAAMLVAVILAVLSLLGERQYQQLRQEVATSQRQVAALEGGLGVLLNQGGGAALQRLAAPPIEIYPLLRILAREVPAEMPLSRLHWQATDNGALLDLEAVTPLSGDLDRERLLSRLAVVCSDLPGGSLSGMPTLAIETTGKEPLLKMKLACKLTPVPDEAR